MSNTLNPAAPDHLPGFIAAPGETDMLFTIVIVVVVAVVLMIGILYFRLHALPEQIAHRTTKVQYEIVAVLGLLSLFTHNHIYWIAGLLLALIQLPDFSTPLTRIAESLARMAGAREQPAPAVELVPPLPRAPRAIDGEPAGHAGKARDLPHA